MLKKLIQWLSSKSNIPEDELILGLIWGLIGGIIGGLIWGLILGLIWGLIWGIIGGLIGGLILGLILGLIWGLGSVIGVNIITSFTTLSFEWYWYILTLLLITEVIFWFLDKSKPKKKDNTLLFTAKRKFFGFLWALGIMTQILGGYYNLQKLRVFITPTVLEEGIKWIEYIGSGLILLTIIISGVYIYISLNSLKYKR